ncbi:MAG: transcription antitermination factor NusB [Gammaproteobacteria bacterium]|nr:MAG: transcription antitermination factor NusB [Gammaproteobacteria bacterium]RTZ75143.1 MAG: transcription antitermination factor NusB [Gammaproteobacteria bacterium]RTZ79267.1 MAG: transcription antitermination factor NusB [Gammaproteobacteria bacterium]
MSRKRSRSRRLAMQALYQWQVTGDDLGEIINHFLTENREKDFESGYFRDLVHGVPARLDELDAALKPFLDRPVEEVDLVERALLRLGAYELLAHPEVPYRVVINEAVELAKTFGADQGHRYINGVLDRVARELRPVEVKAARQRG